MVHESCLDIVSTTRINQFKIKTYCEGCKKMMHPDCYWIYHDVHLGLRLHTLDYINEQRAKISSMMSSTEI